MSPTVRRLDRLDTSVIDALADVLADCVAGGASVGFMAPLSRDSARAFFAGVAVEAEAGRRIVLVGEDAHGIVGTVQVVAAGPENQPHRADIAKMLVHRRARRTGLGAALLQAAECEARAWGKTVLVLDTVTGSDAERLYARCGWQRVGDIPDYALFPDGRLCSTTVFCRRL